MDGGAKRESHIQNAFAQLEKAIESLAAAVSSHGERLVEILRPSTPSITGIGKDVAPEPLTPMAAKIAEAAKKVRNIEAIIVDLRDRTEL